ncbi:MAG: hypothetical protein GXO89_05905 [Chlorobi bacterium]|jgi:hypothetical protein|nr:hypothetical protein [Chlorobiota bacterium]
MKKIENIADANAELFILKHFSNLSHKDRMVRAMRKSVKNTIKQALVSYELGKLN